MRRCRLMQRLLPLQQIIQLQLSHQKKPLLLRQIFNSELPSFQQLLQQRQHQQQPKQRQPQQEP